MGGRLVQHAWCLRQKRRGRTAAHGRQPCGDRGEGCRDAATGRGVHRTARGFQRPGRGTRDFCSAFGRCTALPTPQCQTSARPNCETVHFCRFEPPPSSRQFAGAALESSRRSQGHLPILFTASRLRCAVPALTLKALRGPLVKIHLNASNPAFPQPLG